MAKIPIFYKSSDRYNAGTDVIYDDGSKQQFAPFIYATTQAKDNGGDTPDPEGDDESMVVMINTDNELDKNYKEINDAFSAGKNVIAIFNYGEGNVISGRDIYQVTHMEIDGSDYSVVLLRGQAGVPPTVEVWEFLADSETGVLTGVSP